MAEVETIASAVNIVEVEIIEIVAMTVGWVAANSAGTSFAIRVVTEVELSHQFRLLQDAR